MIEVAIFLPFTYIEEIRSRTDNLGHWIREVIREEFKRTGKEIKEG